MVRWKQETPRDYCGFIERILTLSRVLTEPTAPSATALAAFFFLMASAPADGANAN